MSQRPKYRIYATLLDAFGQYERAEEIWEKYYGFSQYPPCDVDEFREKLKKELIDRINRKPFESEAADRGTAFNEVIDALIEHRKPKDMEVKRTPTMMYEVKYKSWTFHFPIDLCTDIYMRYKGAICQKRVSAILPTSLGDVEVYGVIDELLPITVHDLKTTSDYYVGKFKHNNQHLVYPYALQANGSMIVEFHYDVVEFGKERKDGTQTIRTYKEVYVFNTERDVPILRERVENFVMFIEEHRKEITDKKIFGGESA